jgi:hypothetical protein
MFNDLNGFDELLVESMKRILQYDMIREPHTAEKLLVCLERRCQPRLKLLALP